MTLASNFTSLNVIFSKMGTNNIHLMGSYESSIRVFASVSRGWQVVDLNSFINIFSIISFFQFIPSVFLAPFFEVWIILQNLKIKKFIV